MCSVSGMSNLWYMQKKKNGGGGRAGGARDGGVKKQREQDLATEQWKVIVSHWKYCSSVFQGLFATILSCYRSRKLLLSSSIRFWPVPNHLPDGALQRAQIDDLSRLFISLGVQKNCPFFWTNEVQAGSYWYPVLFWMNYLHFEAYRMNWSIMELWSAHGTNCLVPGNSFNN